MEPSKTKKFISILAAVVLIFAFGCGKAAMEPKQAEQDDPAIVSADTDETDSDSEPNTTHTGVYNVDESTDEKEGGFYTSSSVDQNAILVQSQGILTMSGADIDKTADASGDYTSGTNAAVTVISKGQLTLNTSNVTTSGKGAVGLAVSAEGTQMAINDTSVYTSGESSPAILVREDAAASVTASTLSTEGKDSPCILLLGGRLTLSNVTLTSKSGEILRVLSGDNFLTLDQTAVTAMANFAEGATLTIHLSNGASFSGDLGGVLPARASVYLDASSKLILTADTYLNGFVNVDTTHQNIESNGFSLYYDSNLAENAYLNNQSYLLPGGGFLSPII